MVCMSSNALAPRVLRTGARIAGRLGARWDACTSRPRARSLDASIRTSPTPCTRTFGSRKVWVQRWSGSRRTRRRKVIAFHSARESRTSSSARARGRGGRSSGADRPRQVSRRRARCRRAGCPAHRELSMLSREADRTTQRKAVRRPGWFGAAVAVGVPAAIARVVHGRRKCHRRCRHRRRRGHRVVQMAGETRVNTGLRIVATNGTYYDDVIA